MPQTQTSKKIITNLPFREVVLRRFRENLNVLGLLNPSPTTI